MTEAPWALRGEAVAAWCGDRVVLVAERYVASPVGPYVSLGVARIARVGLRLGLRFSTMVVDNHDRLVAGRRNWGLPGEMGTLSWATVGDETAVVWHERGVELRAVAPGRRFPLVAPVRLLQHRGDGPVVVPTRLRGKARRAAVDVVVPSDDELASLAGEHRGVVITGVAVQLRPARVPAGQMWSARAPSPSPDTAMVRSRRGP
ncbi:MAG: hypothetical protein H0W70_02480 [Actinobacteria bacterium]|nr:hypothetical protein [Actinomycetota bacterium]